MLHNMYIAFLISAYTIGCMQNSELHSNPDYILATEQVAKLIEGESSSVELDMINHILYVDVMYQDNLYSAILGDTEVVVVSRKWSKIKKEATAYFFKELHRL